LIKLNKIFEHFVQVSGTTSFDDMSLVICFSLTVTFQLAASLCSACRLGHADLYLSTGHKKNLAQADSLSKVLT